jgi:hypothetical protein
MNDATLVLFFCYDLRPNVTCCREDRLHTAGSTACRPAELTAHHSVNCLHAEHRRDPHLCQPEAMILLQIKTFRLKAHKREWCCRQRGCNLVKSGVSNQSNQKRFDQAQRLRGDPSLSIGLQAHVG